MIRLVVVLAVAAALGLSGSSAEARPPSSLRVLFLGNSLTATNDLPATVARIASRAGRRLEYRTVAPGGYALEDHWNHDESRAALAGGRWDVVVMQQGPSALPESQVNLREFALRWSAEARAYGARLALLTVWPESWRRAWHCEPGTPLYGRDGFHPSELGTYTAALVVYGRLFRAPLQGGKPPSGIRPRTARLVQWAAATSLGRRLPPARRCGRV